MSTLRFTDGMEIETGGKLRTIWKRDGWYVVGDGTCCPVDSAADGADLIARLKPKSEPLPHPPTVAVTRQGACLVNELRPVKVPRRRKRDRRAGTLSVECMECGRKFKTRSMLPSCPRCGGSDIDLA